MPESPLWHRHDLYAARLVAASPVTLGGITDSDAPLGINTQGERTDGCVTPQIISISEIKPTAKLTSLCLDQWLAVIGSLGIPIASDQTCTGLTLYAQRHQEGGRRATGAVHRSFTYRRGLLRPSDLSVSHTDSAKLGLELTATWDGVNDPIVIADNVALPALSAAATSRFGLGPVTIAGMTFVGKIDWSINFGSTVDAIGADGEVTPRYCSMDSHEPVLTLNGHDLTWFGSTRVPLTGLVGTQVNTALYLRKKASGSTYVADNLTQHVRINLAGTLLPDDAFKAGGKGPATISMKMPIHFDGTNDPVKVTTGVAIA